MTNEELDAKRARLTALAEIYDVPRDAQVALDRAQGDIAALLAEVLHCWAQSSTKKAEYLVRECHETVPYHSL